MQIRIDELKLTNFKNHPSLHIEFKDVLKLSGKNGEGKTSALEAISWILFGTDLLGGSKFDPSPTTYEFDKVYADLLLDHDGTKILFAREIDKGKNVFYINEVPKKAKEYDALVTEMFDKDTFLSMFNPAYFFNLHWNKQREMVMQFTSTPSNKEVFKVMDKPQSEKLSEMVKKKSMKDIEDQYTKQKNDKDKEHMRSQGSVDTLKQQLADMDKPDADVSSAKADVENLTTQIKKLDEEPTKAFEIDRKRSEITSRANTLNQNKQDHLIRYKKFKEAKPKTNCETCGQQLQEDSIKNVEESYKIEKNEAAQKYNHVLAELKKLAAELDELKPIDVTEQKEKVRALEDQRDQLQEKIRSHEQRGKVEAQLTAAKQTEKDALAAKNEAIFILDSIKAYKAKEAELQAGKVQDLFKFLSIRLFDEVKSTGEMKPAFEIQMDGKNYSALSVGERIKAGLELVEVLQKESGTVIPITVDNAESFTEKIHALGQIITCYAVPGQTLQIESEDFE